MAAAMLLQGCASVRTVSKTSPSIRPGETVIVELNNGEIERGPFVAIDSEEIKLSDKSRAVRAIALEDVRQLSVKRTNEDGKVVWMVIGAVALIALAAGLASALEDAAGAAIMGSTP